MIDDDVLELARTKVRIEIADHDRQLELRVASNRREAASMGALNSTRYALEVAKTCQLATKERVTFVWQGLRECLIANGTEYFQGLGKVAKDFVSEFVPEHANWAKWRVEEATKFMANPSMQQATMRQVEQANHSALQGIAADIDLFVLTLKKVKMPSIPSPSINVSGSENVFIQHAGGNARATVSQTVSKTNAEMIDLLDQIKTILLNVESIAGHSKQDVVEVIDDTKSEIAKATPNQSKLKAYFLTISEVVAGLSSIVEKAPALYETFKALAQSGYQILV